jgi:hypothetical protein
MSEQNTNVAEQDGIEADKAPATVYATKAEAEAAWKPTGKYRIFEVSKDSDVMGYVWARGYDNAIAKYARSQGYSASHSSERSAVTKDAVAEKLKEFTDEELAAMGLSRKPQKGGKGK